MGTFCIESSGMSNQSIVNLIIHPMITFRFDRPRRALPACTVRVVAASATGINHLEPCRGFKSVQ